MVGLPVLVPSLISSLHPAVRSAFSAYATAYALTSGNIALLTTEIANVLSGDVMQQPADRGGVVGRHDRRDGGVLAVSAVFSAPRGRWQAEIAMKRIGLRRLDRAAAGGDLFHRAAGDDGRVQPVGRAAAITASPLPQLLARPKLLPSLMTSLELAVATWRR